MPRVVPSQVAEYIEGAFSGLLANPNQAVARAAKPMLAGLVQLADSIPQQLIVLEANEYVAFMVSLEAIRDAVTTWQSRTGDFTLDPIGGSSQNPIVIFHTILKRCPDDVPSAHIAELNFIADEKLRASLRGDLDLVHRALSNAEWKAATVLAGSIVEALLLWSIERRDPNDIKVLGGYAEKVPPNEWTLGQYVAAALKLEHIGPKTATLADLARDFRNLIHPGREARTKERCDRGTALAAAAAVDHVIRDLEGNGSNW